MEMRIRYLLYLIVLLNVVAPASAARCLNMVNTWELASIYDFLKEFSLPAKRKQRFNRIFE